jgi:protein O-mannose beta-1,4-N-acetylglucosaminyltransferase
LCYVPLEKQFIFILSNNSIISGVTNINDLKTIELSSVTNHNGFIMKLIVATKDNAILRRNLITVARGFILWRFKWDNIMHVIHDDLLPLYTTYENICTGNVHKCASKYHVAFADEGELGPLSEWYNIFSRSEPIILHRGGRNNIICFEEGQTGLNGDSVWFQYGFGIPQGPIADTRITRNKLRQFSEFVVDKFKVPISQNLRSINIVFFSRKINRKILNEDSVLKTIEDVYREIFPNSSKLRILNVDFTTNDTRHILSCLLQSQIVVGMHGSAMILTIFLKPGSVIIELFPFGINPQHVSPVKAICDLPDIGLIYNSWSNSEVENTVTYADAPPLLGGISHLSVAEQEQITSISDIPAVKCCHNPAYLYRMFQDTVVGEDFNVVLKTAFLKQKRFSIQVFNENSMSHMLSQWYFPAPVSNIMCTYSSYDRMVMVTWIPPPNTKDPEYRISVVTSVLQFSTNSMQPEVKILLPHSVHGDTTIDLWVKSVEQGQDSLDTYMQCKIHASEY